MWWSKSKHQHLFHLSHLQTFPLREKKRKKKRRKKAKKHLEVIIPTRQPAAGKAGSTPLCISFWTLKQHMGCFPLQYVTGIFPNEHSSYLNTVCRFHSSKLSWHLEYQLSQTWKIGSNYMVGNKREDHYTGSQATLYPKYFSLILERKRSVKVLFPQNTQVLMQDVLAPMHKLLTYSVV